MNLNEVQFFGAVDRKEGRVDGAISSEYPVWYYTKHISDLEEEVARDERTLERGEVHPTVLASSKAELKRNMERLEEIQKSVIKLQGKDKDEAHKIYKELETQIQDSLFTRTDMTKGLADAHEELRRQSEPIFNVKGHTGLFKQMGIKIEKGKASRNQISKVYKILGKALGENTNVERLRKDRLTGTYTEDVPMHRV